MKIRSREKTQIVHVAVAAALAALALATPLFPAARPAQASTQVATGKIAIITAKGSAKFSSAAVVEMTGLKPGDPITRDDMQRVADTLAQLGLFSSVHYSFATTDQGVRIEYSVSDAPSVPVTFDNFPWFTDDELVAALKKNSILFDGYEPLEGKILDQTALALEKVLEERGIFGSVTHQVSTAGPDNHQVMQFKLSGADAIVESFNFSDPSILNDRAIQDRLSDIVGKPFSRSAIQAFDDEQVRPEYISHGYLRVKFDTPVTSFPPGLDKMRSNKVNVLVPVDYGLPYKWNGVKWAGNGAISSADLDMLNILMPGSVANGMEIAALWERVKTTYENQGFLDMTIQPAPQFDDANKLVTFTAAIQEGSQYHMGKLEVSGLSLEGERRIRAAWTIAPGAIFNESLYDAFLNQGIKRAFMGFPAHYDGVQRFLEKDPKAGTLNVLLNFE
ncbi:MAG TPA: POTRA domain-containing protein [Candidatus Acidoferrales bacterium]|nr:POTRA domain-containing protein [Candidatus Acidoferrales bacterium]